MKIRTQSRQSGIALIMVLIVMLVLGILAGRFAYLMKVEVQLARNASYDYELEWMGRSGLELARYVLSEEGKGPWGQFDSLNHKWAGGRGDTNGSLAEIDLSNYPLGRGSIALRIEDQDRKFNLNLADGEILRGALTLVGLEPALVASVSDSILDWIDKNDDPLLAGTESDYYQTLDLPYVAKNGPLDDLSELLMVRGVTPAMYWGSSGGGSRTVVFNRPASRSRFEEPIYAVGLSDLFSVLSGRQVNINTASAAVLQVLPGVDEQLAGAIIAGRSGMDNLPGTDDDGYRSVAELMRVPGMTPPALQVFQRYFTVRSTVFEVHVTARLDGAQREFVGLLRRAGRDIQAVGFHWK